MNALGMKVVVLGMGVAVFAQARTVDSVYTEPEGLVEGAAFIDRFLPVPLVGKLRSDVWGGDNVLPRDVNNGIEDPDWSYWGGNIVKGDDGMYHMFPCRWSSTEKRSEQKQGHRLWPRSIVVHAVSDHPLGPYRVKEEIGKGHNPEIYRLKDGSYILGVAFHGAYRAKTLNGPWEQIEPSYEYLPDVRRSGRDHKNKTNRTYILLDDGRVLMMNKSSYLFISENADEQFVQVTDKLAYPHLPKPAHLEDPVIWKDEVQYNLIVNDCIGRCAIYLRSPDGLEWKWEHGVAYNPFIVKHTDGTTEDWWKLERPKVLQDEYGRAAYMNFAAIDSKKADDLANDIHNSKNIVVPLRVQRRLEILNGEPITPSTKEIRLLIKAEAGFQPLEVVDVDSLKLGAPEEVNFGRGCTALRAEPQGKNLVVTFAGKGNGITEDNFTVKLLGRSKSGDLLFGYAKLP